MKKYICVLIFLLLFANFAIAQQEPAVELAHSGLNILGIITESGIVGILVWLMILTMFPCATILGLGSIMFSIKSDGAKLPFTFKWLILSPLFYFFLGAVGVMYGMVSVGVALASETASAGARIANGFATTIDSALFTLLGMVPFFFFILISMIILHFKRIPSPIKEEVIYE